MDTNSRGDGENNVLGPRSAGNFWRWMVVYLAASSLLMVPSLAYWRAVPFRIIKQEFDFFLGQVSPAWAVGGMDILNEGKCIHFLLFAVVGLSFYKLIIRYGAEIERQTNRTLLLLALGAAGIYSVGLPWVSPDVFYYIAKGWMESHYQLDIYSLALRNSPGFPQDEMYANVFPNFTSSPGNYGPLHQNISASVAGLSGGSVKVALVILKALNVVLFLGAALVTTVIARGKGMPYRQVFLAYALNPVGLFALITCVHNDALQNLFLMLTLLFVVKGRPGISGATLGAALAYKYVAIALAPALLLFWFFQAPSRKSWRSAGLCLLAMIAMVVGCHLLYPGSVRNMLVIYAGGWSPFRASIYYLVAPVIHWLQLVSMETLERGLTLLFVAIGAGISLVPYLRGRRLTTSDLSRQWFWIFATYFMTAVAVVEWYLTWIVGFGLLVNERRYLRGVVLLTCSYLPLVIFTIRSRYQPAANILLYLVMIGSFLTIMWRRGEANKSSNVARSKEDQAAGDA